MPKNKFQDAVFTAIMAAVMVYGMIVYNVAWNTDGVSAMTFLAALHEMPIMFPIAFVLEFFIVGKLAAAKEAGATKVLIPKQNWKENYHNLGIEVIPVATVQELLGAVFLSEGAALSEGIDFLQEKEIG